MADTKKQETKGKSAVMENNFHLKFYYRQMMQHIFRCVWPLDTRQPLPDQMHFGIFPCNLNISRGLLSTPPRLYSENSLV